MKKYEVRLSPLVRLKKSFDAELNLDENGVFNRETYESYLQMQQKSEVKQGQLLSSVFAIDAILFLLLNGQNWSIPGLGVEIASIPAILEILLFLSAMCFYFVCGTFITNQCYIGVIDQFGNRIVNSDRMDPDFFNASRKYFEFFLKLYSPKLNTWGVDFYQHKTAFAVFCAFVNLMTLLTILTLPLAHIFLTWAASANVVETDLSTFTKYFLVISVAVINFTGLLMVIGMSKSFTFKEIEPLGTDHSESLAAGGDKTDDTK